MSRKRLFFGLTLFCFSSHLGSAPAFISAQKEPQCHCGIHGSDKKSIHEQALKSYAQALRRSFDEQWSEADEASDCAGWLDHRSVDWPVNARQFSEEHIH